MSKTSQGIEDDFLYRKETMHIPHCTICNDIGRENERADRRSEQRSFGASGFRTPRDEWCRSCSVSRHPPYKGQLQGVG